MHGQQNIKTWLFFNKQQSFGNRTILDINLHSGSLGLVFEGLKSNVTLYFIRSLRHFGQKNYVLVRWKLLSIKFENTQLNYFFGDSVFVGSTRNSNSTVIPICKP
jgi:hypothetical protein